MCMHRRVALDTETSLDPRPTSDFDPNADHINRAFAFCGEASNHDRWRDAIASNPLSLRHLQRFDDCGANAWIQENHQTGQCRLIFNRCKLRCCPVCSKIAAQRIKSRLETALRGAGKRKWRLITLTIRSEEAPLGVMIDKLKKAFRRLRNDQRWKNHVDGGYAVLEITRSADTGHWHPHFHVVCDGRYFDWKTLRAAWETASHGSTVTDIRAIKNTAGAITYLTAYLGKLAGSLKGQPTECLAEFYRTIQGLRFLIAFGNTPAPAKDPPHNCKSAEWTNVCPLWVYVIALRDGLPWALTLSRIWKKKPLLELEGFDHHPPPLDYAG